MRRPPPIRASLIVGAEPLWGSGGQSDKLVMFTFSVPIGYAGLESAPAACKGLGSQSGAANSKEFLSLVQYGFNHAGFSPQRSHKIMESPKSFGRTAVAGAGVGRPRAPMSGSPLGGPSDPSWTGRPVGSPRDPTGPRTHMRATFDLQSHSINSDGEFEPAAVVRAAAAAGVELLALTDHDSVGGVEEALAEGPRAGVRVIPATELSSVDETYEELHILGYLVDYRDPAFAATLEDLRGDRERRVLAMA